MSDKFSALENIISDRGFYFNSEIFDLTYKNHGINHTFNLVKYPRAKGLIEILNRLFLLSLIQSLIILTEFNKNLSPGHRTLRCKGYSNPTGLTEEVQKYISKEQN